MLALVMVIKPKCLQVLKAQGIGEGAVLDTSKNLMIGRNQSSLFLQGFVNSSLTALCGSMHNERHGPVLPSHLIHQTNGFWNILCFTVFNIAISLYKASFALKYPNMSPERARITNKYVAWLGVLTAS